MEKHKFESLSMYQRLFILLLGLTIIIISVIQIQQTKKQDLWLLGHVPPMRQVPSNTKLSHYQKKEEQFTGSSVDVKNLLIDSRTEGPDHNSTNFDPGVIHINSRLLPDEAPGEDRIMNQLKYHPQVDPNDPLTRPLKTVLLWSGISAWVVQPGRSYFVSANCPVNRCIITYNKTDILKADLVIFKDNDYAMPTIE